MKNSASRVDRLSELPDSLIHLILSFLPMRDVVKTTLLSKQWKDLWTTTPCLNFFELVKLDEEDWTEKARRFVNQALICWRGIRVLKFKISIDCFFDLYLDGDIDLWGSLARDIDSWVGFAVEHKVQDLDIRLVYEELEMSWKESKKYAYRAPLCLNSCSSLKELSLVGCNLHIPTSPLPWNQLKSLKIDGFCYGEQLINCILSGSPQLEVFELRLVECYENLNIRSTSLKKLKIDKYLIYANNRPSKDKVVTICCPNLEILALAGVLYPKYLFTNISSVMDVTLEFDGSYDYTCRNEFLEETMKQIFTTFQHVDKVTLSCWCIQVMGVLFTTLPNVNLFPNLKMLDIVDKSEGSSEFLTMQYGEVETTLFDVYKYKEFETKISKSFMQQLKTVHMTSSLRHASTFRFIELLLKDASMLQKSVIQVVRFAPEDRFNVLRRLRCMPRSSPTAKVILRKL